MFSFFHCPFGVKKGFILRPVLFSLFANEIAVAKYVKAVGKHGIELQPGLVELFLLLTADEFPPIWGSKGVNETMAE